MDQYVAVGLGFYKSLSFRTSEPTVQNIAVQINENSKNHLKGTSNIFDMSNLICKMNYSIQPIKKKSTILKIRFSICRTHYNVKIIDLHH